MKIVMILLGLLFGGAALHAQKYYAVMVTDAKTGKPLQGAAVTIRSTGKVLATSESGNVVIFAAPNDSLLVRFKGYKDRDLQLAGQAAAISIEMDLKPKKTTVSVKRKKRH